MKLVTLLTTIIGVGLLNDSPITRLANSDLANEDYDKACELDRSLC